MISSMSSEARDNPEPLMWLETNKTQTCSMSSPCSKDSSASLQHPLSRV